MESYDHARPFLWSNHLYWYWPSFSKQHLALQDKLNSLHGKDLVEGASLSGFDAIWIDRYAYADNAEALIASLKVDHATQIELDSHRFYVLDLRRTPYHLTPTKPGI
jgi:hypothetical protein